MSSYFVLNQYHTYGYASLNNLSSIV